MPNQALITSPPAKKKSQFSWNETVTEGCILKNLICGRFFFCRINCERLKMCDRSVLDVEQPVHRRSSRCHAYDYGRCLPFITIR
jgi:hypothetical protein